MSTGAGSVGYGLLMREDAVDDEGVESDNDNRNDSTDGQGETNADPLFHCKGILKGIVLEGEMLVKRFNGVERVEDDDQSTELY